jgi:hypothetical protein
VCLVVYQYPIIDHREYRWQKKKLYYSLYTPASIFILVEVALDCNQC